MSVTLVYAWIKNEKWRHISLGLYTMKFSPITPSKQSAAGAVFNVFGMAPMNT